MCGACSDKTFATRGLGPSPAATPGRSGAALGLNHTRAAGASSPLLGPGGGAEAGVPREHLQNKDSGPALD